MTQPPDAPRQLTSLGRTRWADAPSAPVDPHLGGVLLDNITARLAVIDRAERYQYANREMLDFLGAPARAVIGERVVDVIGEAAYASYAPIVDRVWSGETLRIEGWVAFPGRGRVYMVETFVPYGGADGAVDRVAVFGRDFTDLKRRELELAERLAELQRSEALKSAIFDRAFAALVTTDEAGLVVEFNPAAEAMFGRTRAEVVGTAVSEVMIPPRYRAAHEHGMRRMQAGEPGRVLGKTLEMTATRADGSEFPMEMVLWRTVAGGRVFYSASIADLSERHDTARQLERQRASLRQSEKLSAMGSLLAGVAHELNNPLAIVMGRASLLEEKCADDADLRADAARIRAAAERCGRIVRTFLDMARNRPSRREPVSLNDVVGSAADMLAQALRTADVALDLHLDPRAPAVLGDVDQLGQVVMNLVVNAQQALARTAGTRWIRLSTGLAQGAAWLRVEDNGPGVATEQAARLFEPFYTTKLEGAGTGLGLSVSQAIAREHGGELVFEPRPSGASFRLSLPVRDGTVAHAAAASAAPAQARILVVDDETEIAELMRAMLEGAGHEVSTAESGAVALELLDTARFDAVVSDVRMPDMDGEALHRHIAARHPALAGRMLFVTGDTLAPDVRRFLASAASATLDKPFAKSDLLRAVAALLG